MKKWWLVAVGAVLCVAVVVSLILAAIVHDPEVEWTTSSPEALEAYERGIDELAKLYWTDAAPHFERALELDSDFAAAKLQLLLVQSGSEAENERRMLELEQVDVERLTPRERFLLAYWGARFKGESGVAADILQTFQEDFPKDPWAIVTSCDASWEKEAWDRAEACYRRLIDLHPNWVQAQNRLGLIAMAQGQFSRAEEHFRTYGFIAPDQAAPWDALGQLLTVRGEYEEAERAFRQSLDIKDDYCDARWHLVRLYGLRGMLEEAESMLDSVAKTESCEELRRWGLICSRRGWLAYLAGDLPRAKAAFEEGCLERRGGFDFVSHRIALATGDLAAAKELEQALSERLQQKREIGELYLSYQNFLRAVGSHLSGMRHWVEGDLDMACQELTEANDRLLFWGIDRAVFKLFNLRQLVECHSAAGDEVAADCARAEVEGVNPRYLADYNVPELRHF